MAEQGLKVVFHILGMRTKLTLSQILKYQYLYF